MKLRLGAPSKYQGRIRASSFDRIVKKHRKHYRSQTTHLVINAIREYLVMGLPTAKTSYMGTRQAFRSRLIYYITSWEGSKSLIQKDLK